MSKIIILIEKKKEPVNSFDFVDISYENINPDRDQSDFQYKKRYLKHIFQVLTLL